MTSHDVLIATFDTHSNADEAVRELIERGFDMKHFSVVGKGYHTEEKILGFYHAADRMKSWGKYGAFWGAIWGVLFGDVILTLPVIGPVVVAGYFASMVISAIEGAVVVGSLSALGAALFESGVSKDHVVHYESAIRADGFLVMAHGPADELERAREVLEPHAPASLEIHTAAAPETDTRTAGVI